MNWRRLIGMKQYVIDAKFSTIEYLNYDIWAWSTDDATVRFLNEQFVYGKRLIKINVQLKQ